MVLLHVLRKTFLDCLLELLDAVAAGIAHHDLGVFARCLCLLHEFLAALLGERRNGAAYHLTVVLRGETDVGVENSLLDDRDHLLLPRLDGNGLGIRSGDGGHIGDRNHRTVIVDHNRVENQNVGLAGTVGLEVFLKETHCVGHLDLHGVKYSFCVCHFISFRILCGQWLKSSSLPAGRH